MNAYLLLAVAIVSEVFGSSLLKATNGFRKIMPSLGVMIGYGVAFYALSISLMTLPLGVAYAIWSGVGTAVTAMISAIVLDEAFHTFLEIGVVLPVIVG